MIIRKKHKNNGITRTDAHAQEAENLIKQDFSAEKPNEKWLTDITQIPCKDGKLYLAPALNCFDGSIRGLHMTENMRAELSVKAFENACLSDGARRVLLHSDRASQFTSADFRKALKKRGAT